MNILIINCGSSSLKYQLIDTDSKAVLAIGICERIGIEGSKLTHEPEGKEKFIEEKPMKDHQVAVDMVMKALLHEEFGVIKDICEISAVGHRVLHGSKYYSDPVLIDENVKKVIEDCFDLGPLHNPPNLTGINACEAVMPGIPQVAVFDTAFHQTMPEKAYRYAIPPEYYEKYNIRRYGFHGTSHSYVSKRTIEISGLDPNNSKIIVAHLGNGASISAVVNGKCVDTSMGLTPLEGLVMGTRSGDIDAGVLQYISHKEGKSIDEILDLLNKQSGMLGMSGVSSDFRDVYKAELAGNHDAKVANEVFVYRTAKYIGSYVAAMNGVDAIVFTAGVGENDGLKRWEICEYLGYLGVNLEDSQMKLRSEEALISTADSKVKVYVVPTNEELSIAQQTYSLVK
ncbi:MAG TPA: acetate kinase [Clostridiales bacterium]|nr:acetate kinase [Clostridiales bacterium]